MNPTSNSIQLLKPADAAQLLAISERTLWTLTKEGKIPCVRLGRSVRYSVEDLRQTLRSLQNQVRSNH